jgi:hypothetical protein
LLTCTASSNLLLQTSESFLIKHQVGGLIRIDTPANCHCISDVPRHHILCDRLCDGNIYPPPWTAPVLESSAFST